jgi:hypothetical protein
MGKTLFSFLGGYEEIRKSTIHSGIMCISDTIYDVYNLDHVAKLTHCQAEGLNTKKKLSKDHAKPKEDIINAESHFNVPNADELFHILSAAKYKCLIRCCLSKVG